MKPKKQLDDKSASRELALLIAKSAWEKKAEDIVVIDVDELTQFTDYFVLLTADVDQHVKGIADFIIDQVRDRGVKPHHIEGMKGLSWVLLDYIDVIVHIQLPDVRAFYELEALWGEIEPLVLDFPTEE